VPLFLFVPTIAVLFVLGVTRLGVLAILGCLVGGYLFWTLFEYWLHRVVFHFEPEKGIGARLHWIIHGVHHDHPNDPKRLVMPPAVSVPLAAIMFGLFVVVLGLSAAYMFTAAFLAGYLVYDMLHYYLHHHRPRSAVGRWLRELHMRHHFQDDHVGYGISAPWWDHVFGTSKQQARRS
jgi:sterol desaturase/sphingolipid hydroxylase (fatty acid hydroxylase superfamily)